MNDKEAFEKWVESEDRHDGVFGNNNNFTRDSWIAEMTWQAACEYKQKEIDELRDRLTHEVDIDGAAKDHIEILETEIDKWKTAYKEEAEDHSITLKNLQKEIDELKMEIMRIKDQRNKAEFKLCCNNNRNNYESNN